MSHTSSAAPRRPRTVQTHQALVREARKLINERLRDSTLHVGDVAYLLNVSERTLQRAFATCNSDFSRELFEARMSSATRSLSRGLHVGWTARWSGFRSPSHFTKAFSDRFQITPSEFSAACTLQRRLVNRRFKDGIDPVTTGSPEYHRRRKRYTEDVRALQRRIRRMSPAAKSALAKVAPEDRRVFTPEEMAKMRARRTRRFGPYSDEQFERAYEIQLARLETDASFGDANELSLSRFPSFAHAEVESDAPLDGGGRYTTVAEMARERLGGLHDQ